MSDVSTKRKDFCSSLSKPHEDTHPYKTIKITQGKHFLSKIKKFKDEFVFNKIEKIERQKEIQEDDQMIKNDTEFYQAKLNNLTQRLMQNRMELLSTRNKKAEYEMVSLDMYWEIEDMKVKANDLAWDKMKLDRDLKALIKHYDS